MKKMTIWAAIALFIASCNQHYGTDLPLASDPYSETSAICDNAGLDARITSLRDQSSILRGEIGGASVQRQYSLTNKLNRFDAEIEAKHQAAKASCKIFARCMEMNAYQESQCGATLNKWQKADTEFSALAIRLREIDASIEKERLRNSGLPLIKLDDDSLSDPLNSEDCSCSQTGGVFSDCCDRGNW